MPYYRITITDVYGKVYQGVKYDYQENIEMYFIKAHRAALLSLKMTLKSVDVVMLREGCQEVIDYKAQRLKEPYNGPVNTSSHLKDKYAYRPENQKE